MPFAVQVTDDADCNLEEIFDHLPCQDAPGRAERVLERIEQAFHALSAFSERGSHPRELLEFGIREYREVFFKPCRSSTAYGRRRLRSGDRGRTA